jgi:DNA topoisomerase-1
MSPAKYLSIAAKIIAPMDKEYKHNEELAEFPGWKIVRGYDKENANYTFLLTIKNKSKVNYNKIIAKVSIKDLKSHYTEAKLVQLLEEKGIGRPSTFSSLIDKIQERGYVKKDNVTGKKIKCVDYELEKDELQEIEDEREFGNEKNKLVIQPLGVLVLDFLLQHFDKLFDYEYTKNMESSLDSISKGDKIWHELCKECSDDIDECSKDLKSVDKKIMRIDDKHVFMIGKYGPVIKKQEGEQTTFINCKKDLDMDKLERGEYELDQLIEKQNGKKVIGKYKKDDVLLKKGKFGNYIEWGVNKKSLNGIKKDIDEITMEDLIPIIENKVTLNT